MHRTVLVALLLALAAPVHAQEAAASRYIEVWDLNSDGAVALAEIERMRGNIMGRFDENADDVLDATDYVAFDAARTEDITDFDAAADQATMRRIADGLSLTANDANGDGAVSRAEFIAGAATWLADLDRDGDGAVTAADFTAE